ncbi:hypothetical protein [Blastopirellula marina]|uniref:Uncharacterized protein n=1 Tax=Blastopirellula marina DSM 3645 TaxID=314230 RepID=A4A0E2_9BACT|nr:hypothetical protein [Blastopirellula marina]EAQ77762.1 hypothetical protein DSM3645_25372 [Blastopirellula marina DSM 3645]
MNLPFASPHEVAKQLKQHYFPRLHVLPYNRFRVADSTHWWLAPTGAKAAFQHGKLMLTQIDVLVKSGELFCGWNVEKGLLHPGSWQASNVMDSSWYWHSFLTFTGSELEEMIADAREATDKDLQIYVAATIPGQSPAAVVLNVDGSRLKPAAYEASDGILIEVARSGTLNELMAALRNLNGTATAWHWMDVVIGQTFTLDKTGADQTPKCAKFLRAFMPWVRA